MRKKNVRSRAIALIRKNNFSRDGEGGGENDISWKKALI